MHKHNLIDIFAASKKRCIDVWSFQVFSSLRARWRANRLFQRSVKGWKIESYAFSVEKERSRARCQCFSPGRSFLVDLIFLAQNIRDPVHNGFVSETETFPSPNESLNAKR